MESHSLGERVGVVIATRNRAEDLLVALERLTKLEERPPIVVVDNHSTDGTAEIVRDEFANVHVIALANNAAAAARNIGLRHLDTPYVAFADDDSWWAPDALSKSVELFDTHSQLGLVAAKVLVGHEHTIDPTCIEMAHSPLPSDATLPGPRVLGFIACGAVVRRSAFLEAGGFDERFGIGGEEELLALDLSSRGWALCYVDGIVAYHRPSKSRSPQRRRRVVTRNALWTSWLRYPLGQALRTTGTALRTAVRDEAGRGGVVEAAAGLPWILKERKTVASHVQSDLRILKRGRA